MNKKGLAAFIPWIFFMVILGIMINLNSGGVNKNLNYNEFLAALNSGKIDEVKVTPNSTVVDFNGIITLDDGKQAYFNASVPNTEEITSEIYTALAGVDDFVVINPNANNIWTTILSFLPTVIMIIFAFILISKLMNQGGNSKAFDFSKSRAQLQGDIKVRFDDVAGCIEEKEEMKELIDYLKNPKVFSDMGARIPKGILLVGPPGTGKTLLAKAVCGEANVPFYSISGSDFVEMFVGVGASRVRDMFKKAQQTAPCMIFIDEIDAVGRQRGAGLGGGNDEREQTLNQLLVELDGVGDKSGVIVIAATNRPDVLDPALLRPGRFDRQITVSLPDKKGREAILAVHARNKKLEEGIKLELLAKRTPGFSGADLENVLNEAAILAVRAKRKIITVADFDEAIDRVMAGPAKKSRKYEEKEKLLVAYHEVGHAVVGLLNENAKDIEKITIIPRGVAGGYTLFTPKTERNILTKTDLTAQIASYLGGRVAEEVVFNEISTGAYSDLQEATKIAREMVMTYGMSDLGPIQYDAGSKSVFLGRDYGSNTKYSAQTAVEIDKAVREIIGEAHKACHEIIENNRPLLDALANKLLEQETLVYEEIQTIYKEYTGEIIEAEVVKEKPKKTVKKKVKKESDQAS
ncbi:MAG: ATP-dependent zinc metalloprotease FtsH [Erysipelotrichaceae bacterium]